MHDELKDFGNRTWRSVPCPRVQPFCWVLCYRAQATTQQAGFLLGDGGSGRRRGSKPSRWAGEVLRGGSSAEQREHRPTAMDPLGCGLWALWAFGHTSGPSGHTSGQGPERSRCLPLLAQRTTPKAHVEKADSVPFFLSF